MLSTKKINLYGLVKMQFVFKIDLNLNWINVIEKYLYYNIDNYFNL